MAARGYAETQLGLIHFRAEGDGHPLVLIHQTPSSSAMYEPALPFLAKSFRAIAPDTAGYGMSDHVDRPPTMDDYARNVADVIDALGLDRPHIAGHHTGAAIAAETAAAYPDRVGRLVLSGAPLIDAADSRRWNTSFVREYPPREDGGHLLDAWRTMRERRPNDPPRRARQANRAPVDGGPRPVPGLHGRLRVRHGGQVAAHQNAHAGIGRRPRPLPPHAGPGGRSAARRPGSRDPRRRRRHRGGPARGLVPHRRRFPIGGVGPRVSALLAGGRCSARPPPSVTPSTNARGFRPNER